MEDINERTPQSGRMIKSDGTIINIADAITTDDEGNAVLRIS